MHPCCGTEEHKSCQVTHWGRLITSQHRASASQGNEHSARRLAAHPPTWRPTEAVESYGDRRWEIGGVWRRAVWVAATQRVVTSADGAVAWLSLFSHEAPQQRGAAGTAGSGAAVRQHAVAGACAHAVAWGQLRGGLGGGLRRVSQDAGGRGGGGGE